jgi:hypothetical protein
LVVARLVGGLDAQVLHAIGSGATGAGWMGLGHAAAGLGCSCCSGGRRGARRGGAGTATAH